MFRAPERPQAGHTATPESSVALMNEGRAQTGHDDVVALRRKPSIQGSTRCLGVVDRVA